MYHQIVIAGNVGKNAESRFTSAGKQVASFSVATNREYTVNGNKVKETIWFNIATWGKLAEICNAHVKKGMKVLVVGRLNADKDTGGPRVYETNGVHKASFDMTADTVRFLSSKEEMAGEQTPLLPEDEPY